MKQRIKVYVCTQCMYIYTAVAVHRVPKGISRHKAIVVIARRAHCFHNCIYITPIMLL